MREGKYRVWYRGKMVYKSLNDMLVDPSNNFMFLEGKRMQCIEHTDKHGVDIYEDDIVIADWCWTEPHRITSPHDEYDFIEFVLDDANVEIIGNRYQTPDLISAEERQE